MTGPLPCQVDASLLELDCTVLRCSREGDTIWAALDQTPFHPEGGGQPADHGWLGEARVLDVQWGGEGPPLHRLDRALTEGPVRARVEAARRWDHMQQHTGQHLLTAVADREFAAPTLAFHLRPERCDIEVARADLDRACLESLEDRVNDEIRRALPVTHRWVDAVDVAGAGVRSRGLPEGHRGPVRLVEIAGIDVNTCGGTHVSNTAAIQCIKLLGTERTRDGARLFFLAGRRVRSALAEATSRADRAALALGCTTSELPEAAERHARDARLSARALLDLRHELAPLLGSRLAAGDDPVPHLHRPESDMAFLGAIAAGASRAGGRVVLVTGGETPGPGVFVLAGPHEGVQRLAARLRERLGVRGGGPEGRFQGKVSGIEELVAAVRAG